MSEKRYLPDGLPGPAVTPLDAPFWEGTQAGRLLVQLCGACGEAQWPPEEICAACHSFERRWVEAKGAGTVYAWTRAWHPVHPALQGHGPYVVVVVELADYPVRIVGNLLGDARQEVRTGMGVEAVFERHPEGYTLVQWRPA